MGVRGVAPATSRAGGYRCSDGFGGLAMFERGFPAARHNEGE